MPSDEPEWFNEIAAGRLNVPTPHKQRAWATYNKSKRRAERVGPFNFAMTAHAKRLHRGSGHMPRAVVAPRAQTIPERATTIWIDKHNPATPLKARTDGGADHIPGTVSVLAYRDCFDEYRGRPEHKALGPDGQRCHAWTRGILQPPIITATQLVPICKEPFIGADDDPDTSQPNSPEITYAPPTCPICAKPLHGKRVYCSDARRKKAERASS